MKKLIALAIFFVIIIFNVNTAFAESSILKWYAYPSFEPFSVDETSNIDIKSEDIIFDFSEKNRVDLNSQKVNISNIYTLVNNSFKDERLQVALPKVTNPNDILREKIDLTVDGNPINYNIHLGTLSEYFEINDQGMSENYSTDNILNKISNGEYVTKNFSKNQIGKLYTINFDFKNLKLTNKQKEYIDKNEIDEYEPSGKIRIAFNFDRKKTNILTNNFSEITKYSNGTIELTGYSNESNKLEILVLGDDIEFETLTYIDGEPIEMNEEPIHFVSISNQSVKSYIMNYINSKYPTFGNDILESDDEKIYNIYAQLLDECFLRYNGCLSIIDLLKYGNNDRMIIITFNLDFDAEDEKVLALKYDNIGSYNKLDTYTPIHTYEYILGLSSNLKSYNNINLKVITSQKNPYIIDSNINFKKESNNTYIGKLENLSDLNLYFSIYKHSKLPYLSKLTSIYSWAGKFTIPVVVFNIFALSSLIYIFKRLKK